MPFSLSLSSLDADFGGISDCSSLCILLIKDKLSLAFSISSICFLEDTFSLICSLDVYRLMLFGLVLMLNVILCGCKVFLFILVVLVTRRCYLVELMAVVWCYVEVKTWPNPTNFLLKLNDFIIKFCLLCCTRQSFLFPTLVSSWQHPIREKNSK